MGILSHTIGVDNLGVRRHGVNGNSLSAERSVAQRFCVREGDLLNDGRLVQASAGGWGAGILDEEDLIRRRVPLF